MQKTCSCYHSVTGTSAWYTNTQRLNSTNCNMFDRIQYNNWCHWLRLPSTPWKICMWFLQGERVKLFSYVWLLYGSLEKITFNNFLFNFLYFTFLEIFKKQNSGFLLKIHERPLATHCMEWQLLHTWMWVFLTAPLCRPSPALSG